MNQKKYRLVIYSQRLRRIGLRRAAQRARPDRRHQVCPSERYAGWQDYDETSRLTCHMLPVQDWSSITTCRKHYETPANMATTLLIRKPPSAARVVYRYYGGKQTFPNVSDEMMAAVDKADSAQFSREEILDPSDWVLLNYLMDSRTGLGRFREFRVSNYALMMDLIQYCRHHGIAETLALPDVKERVDLYFEHAARAKEQLIRCTRIFGKLAILDLRDEETIFATNRFMIYALFPASQYFHSHPVGRSETEYGICDRQIDS